MRPKLVRALLICALLGANSAIAQQIEDKLVIVTSFSKDVTSPFQQAFEKKYPGTKVEVQNRTGVLAAVAAAIAATRTNIGHVSVVERDADKWARLVKTQGIKPE